MNAPAARAGSAGPSRIAESVAADLRQRILRNSLVDGPLPKQEDLMEQYGVSGPSLREALRILEAEGLITVRRGKLGGAHVHRPSWSSAAYALGLSMQGQDITLRDLAGALITLEPMCALSCASRRDRRSTVVPALRENLEQTRLVIGNGPAFTHVSRTFHHILVDFTANQTLRLMVRSLVAVWSIQEEAWADNVQLTDEYPAESQQRAVLKAHESMTRQIADGDGAALDALAVKHLHATQELVLERFGDRIVDASSAAAVRGFRRL
ncbi:GntR family transcriptional regulator [Nakamurella sp. YIM 132087]|uniref:GntR family transcriptional regulator n=1 Tax=Nakamurella alba TaxID=2665158 RepID=A0A7K1FQ84_9ACTN|nr:GntR family transcriptional regulator [Nakamurella alba]MTD16312.1 GntR family transcriptional regulator [Nakamurella alba]